jgi:alpha-L-fucosidase
MKRLIAAFVLIIICIGLIVASNRTIAYCSTNLLELISQSEKEFNNKESTDYTLSQLNERWERYEPILMIFANHGEIEEIGHSIARVRAGDREDFLKESAELKERLEHLRISESFTLKTFF